MDTPTFPGAEPPARTASFTGAGGIRLAALEWGDPAAPPVVLCHGMWDHARGFALLAPLLAHRFRVVALDARGHGDSEWAHAYSWVTDILDLICVLRIFDRPVHLIGHSKGGGQAVDTARLVPDLVRAVVNIDGFGPPPLPPDAPSPPRQLATFLDVRRSLAARPSWRPWPALEDLVKRRAQQNPRLAPAWLRYFVFHGARQDEDGGWRWKADPHMAHGAGPWGPEWIAPSYAKLAVPLLAVVGSETDTWGPLPEPLLVERLAQARRCTRVTIRGAGHFVHMERPAETAAAILDLLEP